MEALAGARDEAHPRDLRGLLGRATLLPTQSVDYEPAAALYRACRRSGQTVRSVTDGLIGAVAAHHGAPVLHTDADFDVLARYTDVATHLPGL